MDQLYTMFRNALKNIIKIGLLILGIMLVFFLFYATFFITIVVVVICIAFGLYYYIKRKRNAAKYTVEYEVIKDDKR